MKLIEGDCLTYLTWLPDACCDSLVTDPPAGISFMGKQWDSDKGGRKQWIAWLTEIMAECYRVLKPGAHGVVWALPRTSHWTATALEDAGFEVRDVVTHLFGTGFPKSHDVSKAIDKAAGAEREVIGDNQNHRSLKPVHTMSGAPHTGDGSITASATDDAKRWQGWGTALKPASEHWILVRKPLSEKTVAANVLAHGTGAININGCRIAHASDADRASATPQGKVIRNNFKPGESVEGIETNRPDTTQGRFPANVVLSHMPDCVQDCSPDCAVRALDEQSGTLARSSSVPRKRGAKFNGRCYNTGLSGSANNALGGYDDKGGASRFFYIAKASKSDKGAENKHPTVKSTQLMRYLIRLVTPPGGRVLDPFAGSGTTGVAARAEGMRFLGIEQDAEHAATARRRLARPLVRYEVA